MIAMQETKDKAINKENLLITKNDNVNYKRNWCNNEVLQQKLNKEHNTQSAEKSENYQE